MTSSSCFVNLKFVSAVLVFVIFTAVETSFYDRSSVNGGNPCKRCTILGGILRQFMQIYGFNGSQAIDYNIHLLPPEWVTLLEPLEPSLIEKYSPILDSNYTTDVACYAAGLCVVDPGYHPCHLWPLPENELEMEIEKARAEYNIEPISDVCDHPAFRELCQSISLGEPVVIDDPDGDHFKTHPGVRGYCWRGRDCEENNPDVYPGRLPINSDRDFDSNCNGIWGVNPETGNAYEDELCGDQSNYGIVYIGDSIGAHFHVPPDWLRANVVTAELMSNLTFVLNDETDWPHMSWGTGFVNSTWPITIDSPTNSIYWRLRNRNLCNHRDYQNLAFNGAKSSDVMDNVPSMTRDEGRDKPVIVLYAVFGNDICCSDHGTVDEFTPIQDFHDNVLETLDYLESRLPFNSHVFLFGLMNGTYLYSYLQGRLHPLGEINNDVTYDDLYNYLSCMQTVCPAFTNTNTTEQQIATDYAALLSGVLANIASTASYSRFDVHYLPCPMMDAFAQWTGEGWELIEPFDGLHPSKYGQDLFAEVAWEMMTAQFADVLGPVNPNNDLIVQLFGDQGGH